EFARPLHRAADEPPVAEMDAVEDADRHDGVAELGGYLFNPVPDVHAPTLRHAAARAPNRMPHMNASGNANAATADPLADSGLVVVDKPAGMTSHDVVGKLRRIFGTRRVGHSGTLDSMATGVLVLGVNRGTRFLPHVHADAKSYDAT